MTDNNDNRIDGPGTLGEQGSPAPICLAQELTVDGLIDGPNLKQGDILKFFDRCCDSIGMTPYGEPHMAYYAGGWSAVQFIMESSITVHQIGNALWVNIFSCKPFDVDAAVAFTCLHFNTREPNYHMHRRPL